MPVVKANGIDIGYETFGRVTDPAVLLVSGYTSQLLGWDEKLCHLLAAERLWVIRYDNRDVGLTTKTLGDPPDVAALLSARALGQELPPPPYTLSDMAADGMGLLSALGVEQAHVVGASMGGMIVQLMAIEHADRVRSMTSMMSTTGAPDVGQPSPEGLSVLTKPTPTEREAYLDHVTEARRLIAGPLFDPRYWRKRAAMAYERMFWPAAGAFQLAAIGAATDRTSDLAKIDRPCLVVHGRADKLVALSGGEATAAAIPSAKLVVFNDMGHDLAPPLFADYVADIATLIRRAD